MKRPTFGAWLRDALEDCGAITWSQRMEFLERRRCSVSRRALTSWIGGDRYPGRGQMARLLRALNLPRREERAGIRLWLDGP